MPRRWRLKSVLRERHRLSSTKHLLAGFFTGAFGHLAARKVSAREVCCRSRGAPQCEFVLVGGERASALDRVVASGASSIGSARPAPRKPTRGPT